MPDGSLPEIARTLPVKPDTVRVATIHDEQALFDLLWNHTFHENYVGFPASEKKALEWIGAVCQGNGIAGVIDGPDGDLIGSVGIIPAQVWFSDTWYLSQIWNHVRSNHRKGTGYGNDLFKFILWHHADMSRRLGYEIMMENSFYSLSQVEAKERLWRRYGKKVGSFFWMKDGRDE